jgi:hypothetical protein
MITELELTGDGQDDGEGPGPAPDVVDDYRRGGPSRPVAPPWLWGALAGAVAASAVWAVLLVTGVGPYHDNRPDLHGYRIDGSPCAGGTFSALAKAVKATGSEATPASIVHGTAVDRAQCTFSANASPAVGWTTSYAVDLSVDLHKLADTRQEFEQERSFDTSSLTVADHSVPVRGLGDEAYALTFTGEAQELKVLRGGAVITMRLTAHTFWSGSGYGPGPDGVVADTAALPGTPGLSAFRPALTATARTLLATLKS